MPNEIKTPEIILNDACVEFGYKDIRHLLEMVDDGNRSYSDAINVITSAIRNAQQFQQEVTDEQIYFQARAYVDRDLPKYEREINVERLKCFDDGAKWMRDRLKPKQQQEDKESKEYFNQAVTDTCGELLTSHRELLQRLYNEIRSRFNPNDEMAFNSMSEPLATIMKECSKLLSDYEKLK